MFIVIICLTLFFIAWTIFGIVLFYNDINNCSEQLKNYIKSSLIIKLLFCGYIIKKYQSFIYKALIEYFFTNTNTNNTNTNNTNN